MIRLKIALAAGAVMLFAGAAFAQTSAIEGEVKGEDGKGLKDALIKIERKDIKGNYKVKTDKKGHYYYGGLPLGLYTVVCEVGGKDIDKVDNVKTGLGEPRAVNFDLQQLKARQEQFAKAAETGQLTQEQTRGMSAEQKAALEKANAERSKQMAKNKALNDAFNGGMQALQAKQYEPAIESFKKAAEVDPNQHVVWAHLGDSYLGAAQTKTGAEHDQLVTQGLDAWNKAITLAPNDAGYHNNYALALARAKKFDEAEAELQKAATLDPTNAGKYYYNLGALLVNSGQNDQAVEAFKRAIAADPNYAEAHYQYGLALMGKAQTDASGKIVPPEGTKEEFQKYLEVAPNGPNAEAAKAMLQTIDSSIQTNYMSPAAKAAAEKAKQRKKK